MNKKENTNPNKTELICEDCGKKKQDVVETYCPYSEEMNNRMVSATLCRDCFRERIMDI